jgi:hypothetical protein
MHLIGSTVEAPVLASAILKILLLTFRTIMIFCGILVIIETTSRVKGVLYN